MRDVSRILSDAELLKIRELLKSMPQGGQPIDEHTFQEYPKMLFSPEWLILYRLQRDHPDPLIVKEAKEKIRREQVIVHDFETEEEYILDGWKTDPNDLIIALGEADPRIPTGREARRAASDSKRDRAQRLQALKREYALLTGRPLNDDALDESEAPEPKSVVVDEDGADEAPDVAAVARQTTKRERVAAATKSATAKPARHATHA